MASKFKHDFEGTGTFVEFVSACNRLFEAMSNITVVMPVDYRGTEPTLVASTDGTITFDMGDALIFTTNNIDWELSGDATFESYSAEVVNGKLVISVEANNTP